MLLLMEGGRREEFLWAGLGGGGLICTGYGVRMALDGTATWGLLTFVGIFVIGLAYIGVQRIAPQLNIADVPEAVTSSR